MASLSPVSVVDGFPWTRYQAVGTFALIMGILSFFFTLAHVRTNNCPSGFVSLSCWIITGRHKTSYFLNVIKKVKVELRP